MSAKKSEDTNEKEQSARLQRLRKERERERDTERETERKEERLKGRAKREGSPHAKRRRRKKKEEEKREESNMRWRRESQKEEGRRGRWEAKRFGKTEGFCNKCGAEGESSQATIDTSRGATARLSQGGLVPAMTRKPRAPDPLPCGDCPSQIAKIPPAPDPRGHATPGAMSSESHHGDRLGRGATAPLRLARPGPFPMRSPRWAEGPTIPKSGKRP